MRTQLEYRPRSQRIEVCDGARALARSLDVSTEVVILACFGWLARIATGETTVILNATTGAARIAVPCTIDDGASLQEVVTQVRAAEGAVTCDVEGLALSLQVDGPALVQHDISSEVLRRWAEVLEHLLAEVGRHGTAALGTLELVPDAQRACLIELGGNHDADTTSDTIGQMFAACVARAPHQRAVVDETTALTYDELDRRAGALARQLVDSGVCPGDRVAIEMPPSVHVAVAMLGVLRARGAYVPLDPGLPEERRRFILADAGARLVLGVGRGDIDVAALAETAPAVPTGSERDAAYVIYTSGTTGQPKGVVIEQRSLVNYVRWMQSTYRIDERHVAALLTSYAFDLGYTTLWTTLLAGGELHFLSESACRDVAELPAYIRAHGVSFIKVTPSLLGALVRSTRFDRAHCGSLRLVVCGGEPIRLDDVATVYARCPDALVVNHYGPTETTIGVMTHPIERARVAERTSPVIGRPIGNTQAYVVSPNLALVPLGAPGELLVGGAGVARGYHARDELTRSKFLADPFATSGRVYRTGDLVRWTEHGTLEFLGRIDRQVKVRGYRVELSEIEHVLLHELRLDEVVVVDRANGILCAYYVAAQAVDSVDARAALAAVLPEYMVPAHYTQVAELPRTANGKLDIARLPPPLAEAPPVDAPLSSTEQALAALWADILGIPASQIGIGQNFFELGGHSLLVIQLIADIDDKFAVAISMPAFFETGTIGSLARLIDEAR